MEFCEFLAANDTNQSFDAAYALRLCTLEVPRRLPRVHLYGMLSMYAQAVDAALDLEDLTLAKDQASREVDPTLRKKLWLRILERVAQKNDSSMVIQLFKESQLLGIKDALPYLADSTLIAQVRDEIVDCLDMYENQISDLRREMKDHREAVDSLQVTLKETCEQFVQLPSNATCELCGLDIYSARFYVFGCGHIFHSECLKNVVTLNMTPDMQERLEACPSVAAEDDLIAADCLLCGHWMIQSIYRPFFTSVEDAREISEWSVEDAREIAEWSVEDL
jgi:hypothetical protein